MYKYENHVTRNDVIMISLPKTMENAEVQKTIQVIYDSKGLEESYGKMQVLSNLSNFLKSYRHLSEILVFLPQAFTKYMLKSRDSC